MSAANEDESGNENGDDDDLGEVQRADGILFAEVGYVPELLE